MLKIVGAGYFRRVFHGAILQTSLFNTRGITKYVYYGYTLYAWIQVLRFQSIIPAQSPWKTQQNRAQNYKFKSNASCNSVALVIWHCYVLCGPLPSSAGRDWNDFGCKGSLKSTLCTGNVRIDRLLQKCLCNYFCPGLKMWTTIILLEDVIILAC